MTQQEQHIALAEWKAGTPLIQTECPDCFGTGFGGSELDHDPCDTCKTTGKVTPYYKLPELTLDWLHEAELKLTDNQYREWHYQLKRLRNEEDKSICKCHSATKEQRLEALCRTLWPEKFK